MQLDFINHGVGKPDPVRTFKCDSGDPQITTLNWSFGSGETVLTIAGTAYTLEQLTETTLVYSSSSSNSGSTDSTRYTYHH